MSYAMSWDLRRPFDAASRAPISAHRTYRTGMGLRMGMGMGMGIARNMKRQDAKTPSREEDQFTPRLAAVDERRGDDHLILISDLGVVASWRFNHSADGSVSTHASTHGSARTAGRA